MKFLTTLLLAAQALLAQENKPVQKQLVTIVGIDDSKFEDAQLNTCFKIPQKKLNKISVKKAHRLQIYSSPDCTDGQLFEVEGTFTVSGSNTEKWLSAVVPTPVDTDLVIITGTDDKEWNEAKLNVCFDFPKNEIWQLELKRDLHLKVYSSKDCQGNELFDFEGTAIINGSNDETWVSAVVPNPNPNSHRKHYLREANGHRRHGGKYHSYRAYRD